MAIKWRSVVCKDIPALYIEGKPCLKDIGIEEDIVKNIIHLHNRTETVQPTNPMTIFKSAEGFNVEHPAEAIMRTGLR